MSDFLSLRWSLTLRLKLGRKRMWSIRQNWNGNTMENVEKTTLWKKLRHKNCTFLFNIQSVHHRPWFWVCSKVQGASAETRRCRPLCHTVTYTEHHIYNFNRNEIGAMTQISHNVKKSVTSVKAIALFSMVNDVNSGIANTLINQMVQHFDDSTTTAHQNRNVKRLTRKRGRHICANKLVLPLGRTNKKLSKVTIKII